MEGLANAFREKGVPVLDNVKTDTSAAFVFVKLLDQLKDHFQLRPDLIERSQAQALSRAALQLHERSYTYQQSKFGRHSPLSPSNPVKVRDHAVAYRERIYYLSDAAEQRKFLAEPSKYTKGVEAVPLDVLVKPKVAVLGLPRSGKSTLCAKIAELTGAVHLQMGEIIEASLEADAVQGDRLRACLKRDGRGVDDQLLIALLTKRLQGRDCLANGWVLEDFPKTKAQAIALARAGVTPANVVHMRISLEEVYKRTEAEVDTDFGANRTILAQGLRYLEANLPHVLAFYQRLYDSLVEIDGIKSKWYVEDRAMEVLEANLKARQHFATAQCHVGKATERPSEVQDLHCDRALLKSSLS